MKALILAVLFLSNPLYAKDAWWLNAEFKAKEKQILGIPAKSMDSSFESVSLLTSDAVIKQFPEAKNDLANTQSVFEINKTHKGKRHRILVGVYSGPRENGAFLLVVQKEKANWKTIFLEKTPGKRGFGILRDVGDSILWNNCLACGHSAVLKWDEKKGYYFEAQIDEQED